MAGEGGDKPASYRQIRFERPEGSSEIFLIRHAESAAANPAEPFPLLDGRGDPELSEEGRAQAETLASALAGLAFDAIYVSDLKRTAQTAEPLARGRGLTLRVEADLTEVHMGEWEGGLYRQKIALKDPLVAKLFAEGRWDVIPGGESNESLLERTTEAVARIARAHPNGRVAVFSHAVAISAILSHVTKSSIFAFIAADNASISRVVVGSQTWAIRSFNEHASGY